jgi:hypothetical protein
MASIDNIWKQDYWFKRHWADKMTLEFQEWWFKYYGRLEYSDNDDHEYYIRAGMALAGWLAARGELPKL